MNLKNTKHFFVLCSIGVLLALLLFFYLLISFPSTKAPFGDSIDKKIENQTNIRELRDLSKQMVDWIDFSARCNLIFLKIVLSYLILNIIIFGLSLFLMRNLKKETSKNI